MCASVKKQNYPDATGVKSYDIKEEEVKSLFNYELKEPLKKRKLTTNLIKGAKILTDH